MATYVVGAGGIGCTVGYALLTAGETVIFVECDEQKLKWGHRHGIVVDNHEAKSVSFLHFNDWKPIAGDVALLCVKCFDNAGVLAKLANGVNVIPIQNGFDALLDSRNHTHEAIASYVAKCEPGTTRAWITRPGQLHFGSRMGRGSAIRIASRFNGHLFKVKFVDDIRPIKAAKLMYNAAISPLAAAAGLDNGQLLTDPLARELFFGLLKENYSILTAANVPLGKVGPFHPHTVSKILRTPGLAKLMAKFFVRSLRGTYCSMADDIELGRTELDNYTGHLLRLAGNAIPAPLNRAVFEVVSSLTKPERGILPVIRDAAAKHR
jgi:2-dehydropantoate 2-reductase